ncbi:hypothetical protein WOSG25_190060 [Weissella oryzae SG25]|uniref:Uncharacterized protein n=1 Tax=Weissella oryzae (strain DSM 25784 / JCM 18191 / LMG 30913 / SG25) TaxID=1329250 RepID=A0A069CXF1_WEIOS|nr:antirestriction protein ArdA [Weissella oryzae]GAK31898.1 hypothetical protein WOSG25_190060 [Weissella oryzae SG25]
MEINIKIFVGLVSSPASGVWATLPMSVSDIKRELVKRGVLSSPDEDKELMISDYEAPFKISEFERVERLNEVIYNVADVDIDSDVFEALVEDGRIDIFDFDVSEVEDLNVVEADSEEDLASSVIEEVGGVSELGEETLNQYFDYKAYGRDLVLGGDFTNLGNGYFVGN